MEEKIAFSRRRAIAGIGAGIASLTAARAIAGTGNMDNVSAQTLWG